jgi:hypothetical protein
LDDIEERMAAFDAAFDADPPQLWPEDGRG